MNAFIMLVSSVALLMFSPAPVKAILELTNPTMASTYDNYGASKAIDGNTGNGKMTSGHCAHSVAGTLNESWKAELLTQAVIDRVNIFPRTDCCQDRYVNVKIWIKAEAESSEWLLCKDWENLLQRQQGWAIGKCPNTKAKYIKITQGNSEALQLCEVEVYGYTAGSKDKWLMEKLRKTVVAQGEEIKDLKKSMSLCGQSYYYTRGGSIRHAPLHFPQYAATFIGKGMGLNSAGINANQYANGNLGHMSLEQCLKKCSDKRKGDLTINGVHYNYRDTACYCEKNWVKQEGIHTSFLHYKLL